MMILTASGIAGGFLSSRRDMKEAPTGRLDIVRVTE
jgi:hypothetical protein